MSKILQAYRADMEKAAQVMEDPIANVGLMGGVGLGAGILAGSGLRRGYHKNLQRQIAEVGRRAQRVMGLSRAIGAGKVLGLGGAAIATPLLLSKLFSGKKEEGPIEKSGQVPTTSITGALLGGTVFPKEERVRAVNQIGDYSDMLRSYGPGINVSKEIATNRANRSWGKKQPKGFMSGLYDPSVSLEEGLKRRKTEVENEVYQQVGDKGKFYKEQLAKAVPWSLGIYKRQKMLPSESSFNKEVAHRATLERPKIIEALADQKKQRARERLRAAEKKFKAGDDLSYEERKLLREKGSADYLEMEPEIERKARAKDWASRKGVGAKPLHLSGFLSTPEGIGVGAAAGGLLAGTALSGAGKSARLRRKLRAAQEAARLGEQEARHARSLSGGVETLGSLFKKLRR